jgi:hypothetical protein
MSRGLGRVERFILDQVEALSPGSVVPLPVLADKYARERNLPYGRGVIETVRRAILSLECKRLITAGLQGLPIASTKPRSARSRDMLVLPSPRDGGMAVVNRL